MQYIGARYTIKVYENTLDPSSAEWQSGMSYEPLTMVNYNNSSYLSKKAVPANIGNPAANGAYWALTGAYNGQILDLQNRVDAIENTDLPAIQSDITALKNNKRSRFDYGDNDDIIVIGDSWANGLHATHGLAYWMDQRLPHNNCYISCENGAGFVHLGGSNHNFLDLLQGVSVADANKIRHIIVLGGVNDRNELNITDAIVTFYNYMVTTFPNAALDVVVTNRLKFPTGALPTIYGYINDYMAASYLPRCRAFNLTHMIPFNNWYDDGHLNENGYSTFAFVIKNALVGAPYGLAPTQTTATGTNSDYNVSGSFTMIQNEGDYILNTPTLNVVAPTVGDSVFKRLEFTFDDVLQGTSSIYGMTSVYVRYQDDSYRMLPCKMQLINSQKIRYEWNDPDTVTSYKSVYINAGSMHFGKIY